MRSITIIALGGIFLLFASVIKAQVNFRLSLMPDQQTYMVSLQSDHTWSTPLNAVGSAQVVLQVPAGVPFSVGSITSYIPGVTWLDNAYVENTPSAPDHIFVCFSLEERGTKLIPLEAGSEIPLFSFVNTQNHCLENANLIDNNNPLILEVINQDRANITQNFTVLGARGNAFSGILSDPIECSPAGTEEMQLVRNLKVFPNPASSRINIAWEMPGDRDVEFLMITDFLGQQMAVHKIQPGAGNRNIELDVSVYPAGIYKAFLANSANTRQFFHFVVTPF